VDKITRAEPEQMRPYVANILDTCMDGGGFALGVGNWVADTIPFDNYLAVLETARDYA
jgi:uroporphyrinogen decarboxylase